MKDKNKFLLASMSVGLLGLVFASSTSALTYQEEIPVSFTFNRGLSLTVSASDLHIYNLVPGNSDESNIITVTTTSNNATGYVLTASVGNSTKNTTNLVNGSNNFASIATNASQASLTTDNTWGYSISTNNGSSWSNYSGLPIFSSTTWKEIASTNANGTTSILFKIGAKASSSQAAGDYTNVINFTAVTNFAPVSITDALGSAGKSQHNGYYKMQDMNQSICGAVELNGESSQTQLIDIRDNKVYYVAKLADGNCWMTQNLDFDIDSTRTYTTSDTNISSSWTPSLSTYPTNNTTWTNSYRSPESYDPGDLCWNGTIYTQNGALNNRTTSCAQNGNHYHIGNYYNLPAAFGNFVYGYEYHVGDVINGNICPAGWTLPGTNKNDLSSGSFGYLVDELSLTSGINGNIHASPVYFVYNGYKNTDGLVSFGYYGNYWTKVASIETVSRAYMLKFLGDGEIGSFGIDGADSIGGIGQPIRCIVK